ncbi:fasciclin domain-containing protein [Pontivivens insulae]|uniref:Immunogenic protein MPB70 n=1 Tax=Pontivivens insulae TaxID=1639689 RepID=A0A2R8ABG8_9RHOB|nr:fasciclin domain-containing protein [Pontivivens insulae]RED11270.1 putative surface protein with fasciclin (FAS1) repeats [Pontivivens insulae]SPF29557.1 Immunogenic protein MPB70 [Pontivivens insulae]
MNRILAAATALTLTAAPAAFAAEADIVDTAASAGSFETLVAAVQAAGLVDVLKGDGPFTVFAPTDEAFAALPDGTVETLLLPENIDQLTAILTYHVVPGEVMAADILGTDFAAVTVNGEAISVNGLHSGVTINDATVVAADVDASNGVIHVIDSVLLPPQG